MDRLTARIKSLEIIAIAHTIVLSILTIAIVFTNVNVILMNKQVFRLTSAVVLAVTQNTQSAAISKKKNGIPEFHDAVISIPEEK